MSKSIKDAERAPAFRILFYFWCLLLLMLDLFFKDFSISYSKIILFLKNLSWFNTSSRVSHWQLVLRPWMIWWVFQVVWSVKAPTDTCMTSRARSGWRTRSETHLHFVYIYVLLYLQSNYVHHYPLFSSVWLLWAQTRCCYVAPSSGTHSGLWELLSTLAMTPNWCR